MTICLGTHQDTTLDYHVTEVVWLCALSKFNRTVLYVLVDYPLNYST